MTNVEIEDVLSSIRRLVSEDLKAGTERPSVQQARGGAVPKLVLTPALRVEGGAAQAGAVPRSGDGAPAPWNTPDARLMDRWPDADGGGGAIAGAGDEQAEDAGVARTLHGGAPPVTASGRDLPDAEAVEADWAMAAEAEWDAGEAEALAAGGVLEAEAGADAVADATGSGAWQPGSAAEAALAEPVAEPGVAGEVEADRDALALAAPASGAPESALPKDGGPEDVGRHPGVPDPGVPGRFGTTLKASPDLPATDRASWLGGAAEAGRAGGARPGQFALSEAASLERTIAELEAAVAGIEGEFEPDFAPDFDPDLAPDGGDGDGGNGGDDGRAVPTRPAGDPGSRPRAAQGAEADTPPARNGPPGAVGGADGGLPSDAGLESLDEPISGLSFAHRTASAWSAAGADTATGRTGIPHGAAGSAGTDWLGTGPTAPVEPGANALWFRRVSAGIAGVTGEAPDGAGPAAPMPEPDEGAAALPGRWAKVQAEDDMAAEAGPLRAEEAEFAWPGPRAADSDPAGAPRPAPAPVPAPLQESGATAGDPAGPGAQAGSFAGTMAGTLAGTLAAKLAGKLAGAGRLYRTAGTDRALAAAGGPAATEPPEGDGQAGDGPVDGAAGPASQPPADRGAGFSGVRPGDAQAAARRDATADRDHGNRAGVDPGAPFRTDGPDGRSHDSDAARRLHFGASAAMPPQPGPADNPAGDPAAGPPQGPVADPTGADAGDDVRRGPRIIRPGEPQDDDPGANIFGGDLAHGMDPDVLRDMVAEIIRQELQGTLGERITRSVRKLVRREIHRMRESRDLE